MLELRPPERFPDLEEAAEAVRRARDPQAQSLPVITAPPKATSPDDLAPGMRVGVDYEVLSRLGQGGMAVVFAARHLPSGRTRALKISRPEVPAEEALRGEYQVLSGLDHSNIVRILDLSKMFEDHLTLVMERVGGETLRHRLNRAAPARSPDPAPLRRGPARRARLPRAEERHAQGPQARQPAGRRRRPDGDRLQPRVDAGGCAVRRHGAVPRSGAPHLDPRDRSLRRRPLHVRALRGPARVRRQGPRARPVAAAFARRTSIPRGSRPSSRRRSTRCPSSASPRRGRCATRCCSRSAPGSRSRPRAPRPSGSIRRRRCAPRRSLRAPSTSSPAPACRRSASCWRSATCRSARSVTSARRRSATSSRSRASCGRAASPRPVRRCNPTRRSCRRSSTARSPWSGSR